ncbi:hypothetical protein ABBQ32_007719 [Trebouxia sp. C0010 RCD-2024]
MQVWSVCQNMQGNNTPVIDHVRDRLAQELSRDTHIGCNHASLLPSVEWVVRTMPHSQQNNFDDCGVFALLFANQLAIGADLNLIQPNRVAQFRIYITLCFLEQLQPSLVIDHSREANHSEASGMAGVYAEIHGPCGFPPGTPRVPTYVYTYVHCNCS